MNSPRFEFTARLTLTCRGSGELWVRVFAAPLSKMETLVLLGILTRGGKKNDNSDNVSLLLYKERQRGELTAAPALARLSVLW